MKSGEITPQFVTDESGNKTGVYLSIEDFNKILDMLEDQADVEDYDEAIKEPRESITLEEFERQLAEEE